MQPHKIYGYINLSNTSYKDLIIAIDGEPLAANLNVHKLCKSVDMKI
jgi:hypothetical protein